MDNEELVRTDIRYWLPCHSVTTARPQIWHPQLLKARKLSISGNGESYVVYNEATFSAGSWKLRPLPITEVASYPEEILGWNSPYPSITHLSRASVKRVTAATRDIMRKGNNKFRGQQTIAYTRAEWAMWCERTMSDEDCEQMKWHQCEGRNSSFIDGSFSSCHLVTKAEEQRSQHKGRKQLRLIEWADSYFSLCVLPAGIEDGNARYLDIEPGHEVRQCTSLNLQFRCSIGETVGKLHIKATYKCVLVKSEVGFVENTFMRGYSGPPPPSGTEDWQGIMSPRAPFV